MVAEVLAAQDQQVDVQVLEDQAVVAQEANQGAVVQAVNPVVVAQVADLEAADQEAHQAEPVRVANPVVAEANLAAEEEIDKSLFAYY